MTRRKKKHKNITHINNVTAQANLVKKKNKHQAGVPRESLPRQEQELQFLIY